MNRTKRFMSTISSFSRQAHPSAWRCNSPVTMLRCEQDSTYSLDPSISVQSISRWSPPQIFQFCSESSRKRTSRCWNCDFIPEKFPFLFCESCRSIQPMDHSIDYFQVFGLENKYDIEAKSLEGKYKDWQKKLHPDLVHNKSERERGYAAEQSAKVTEAYRTLTKPLSRAIYIMRLNGVNVNEEETVDDPELLMEIMELREAVDEANDSKTLNHIRSQVVEKLKDWCESFVDAFEKQKFDEAVRCIQRMTYYERINEEICRKL